MLACSVSTTLALEHERLGRVGHLAWWCETDDHDDDWFVVARNEDDAASYHEGAERYGEDDATAELVCVIPAGSQALAMTRGVGWPSNELLLSCGAECLPNVSQDGLNELRRRMDSGPVWFGSRAESLPKAPS